MLIKQTIFSNLCKQIYRFERKTLPKDVNDFFKYCIYIARVGCPRLIDLQENHFDDYIPIVEHDEKLRLYINKLIEAYDLWNEEFCTIYLKQ